ncbi:MAG TPA: toll/interleukin-1 receptor domain-containing protein [Pyrinomonadaceae bacterium]|nr:toll/interleukin-1 receptor domain-containing protein [Pyrinomonadaceae bacterium]
MSEQLKFEGPIFGYDTLIKDEGNCVSLRGKGKPELRRGVKAKLSDDSRGYVSGGFHPGEKVTIVELREPHQQGNSDHIVCVSNGEKLAWIKPSNIDQILRHQVFISYSHKDKNWLERLLFHLQPLEKSGTLIRWDDTLIRSGSKWRDDIEKALNLTQVAVLLISPAFLASNFIVNNELAPLLNAANEDGAVILPVIISHCSFEQVPSLAEFQSVNSAAEPLDSLSEALLEAEFANLVSAIESILRD